MGGKSETECGNPSYKAEVAEITDSGFKFTYAYYGSDAEVAKYDVKATNKPLEVKTEFLYFYGLDLGLGNVKLQLRKCLEKDYSVELGCDTDLASNSIPM